MLTIFLIKSFTKSIYFNILKYINVFHFYISMNVNITMSKEDYYIIKKHCEEEGKTFSGYLRRLALNDIRENGTEQRVKVKWNLFG